MRMNQPESFAVPGRTGYSDYGAYDSLDQLDSDIAAGMVGTQNAAAKQSDNSEQKQQEEKEEDVDDSYGSYQCAPVNLSKEDESELEDDGYSAYADVSSYAANTAAKVVTSASSADKEEKKEEPEPTNGAAAPDDDDDDEVDDTHVVVPVNAGVHVAYSGFMTKRGRFLKTWRRRWFTVVRGLEVHSKRKVAPLADPAASGTSADPAPSPNTFSMLYYKQKGAAKLAHDTLIFKKHKGVLCLAGALVEIFPMEVSERDRSWGCCALSTHLPASCAARRTAERTALV